MNRVLVALAFLFLFLAPGRAQFGSFGDSPVEVDAEDQRFVNGVYVAERNVIIRYGDTAIYADYAEYSPDSRDALVRGNVRVYRGDQVFTAERGLYNFETKVFRAAEVQGDKDPFKYSAETIGSMGPKDYVVRQGIFTTSDSSKPDYYLSAKRVRIYPKDRIVFSNVTLYVGTTPVFWWPYLYQPLDHEAAFTISPGYRGEWGGFLLTAYSFPIAEKMTGKLHLDLYSERGVGLGFDSKFSYGKDDRSTGEFRSYYISDSQATSNNPTPENTDRYRVSLQHKLFIKDDIFANIDINVISDRYFLKDFFEGEYRKDPQPDNLISVTKVSENYSLTLITRAQVNEWQEVTERLPELVFDSKRMPLWNTGIFYEGETGVGYLRRANADGIVLPDYDYFRFDSFHQILYPKMYRGWLSFVPRFGLRMTHYTDSGQFVTNDKPFEVELADGTTVELHKTVTELETNGSLFRLAANAGFEASTKFSKEWEIESRKWGLDGLRHVVQPYTNLSLVESTHDSSEILKIDNYIPSTELPPIDFPEFRMVDSVTSWSIWRWGVRNFLQTRRDNRTFNWLQADSFLDINLQKPDFFGAAEPGTFSNFHTNVRWTPLPWMGFRLESQLPIDNGFTQLNTSVNVMPTRDLSLSLRHRLISDNPFFGDDNSLSLGGYYRINDNWAFSWLDTYEFQSATLQRQTYEIHRDLSSWVATLGFIFRDNSGGSGNNKNEFGVLLTLTLKDIPEINLPLNLTPSQGD